MQEGQRVKLSAAGISRYGQSRASWSGTLLCSCSPYTVRWDESGLTSNHEESQLQLINDKSNSTMTKFFRVKQELPAWGVGAIISNERDSNKYRTTNDLWDKDCIADLNYHESQDVVEKSPDWFERVYPVNLLTKTVYKLKAEAQEMLTKEVSA